LRSDLPRRRRWATVAGVNPAGSSEAPPLARSGYWLTRFVLLRLLGLIYAVAFLAAARQVLPLIGSHGLLPLDPYLSRAQEYFLRAGSTGFRSLPSLFWYWHSDRALVVAAWSGFALACVVVAGFANAPIMLALWALYMSFVHLGQLWYGYGWETQLLETGFLAVFLCPLVDARPFPRRKPPTVVLWLFRWLIFRVMLGSALIKLRGDEVWRNLTALYYHFETQPIPGPLSRWFHFLPRAVLRGGVLFNYATELVAPWFVFWPCLARRIAGLVIILFQLTLILSGNLSFFNWITIVPALACLDDAFWARVLPGALVRRAARAAAAAQPSPGPAIAGWALAGVIAFLSYEPVMNLFSPHQLMNTSFQSLDLVNTYGAFGSVGTERLNVVFEGTDDAVPGDDAHWKAYPYRYLPVDVMRRPPQIAPYQPRLDWQMWFASMSDYRHYPWTVHLVWKLLHNDPGTLGLFESNPFPGKPPRFIRAVTYRYRFAPPGNPEGRWWDRERIGLWLPPLSADNPGLEQFLSEQGWLN
jgi:hypothetical protein